VSEKPTPLGSSQTLTPSRRMRDGVQRSGARRMMDLAWSIPDAIHLEIGEPDFRAPPHVIDAAIDAMQSGRMGYPPTAGFPELRERLVSKLARVNSIDTTTDLVTVTNGGCQGLYNVFSVLLDEGDTVAIPDPGWPNYRSMVGLNGGRCEPYRLVAHDAYRPDFEHLEQLGRQGCRAVVLNNPSNPLGTVMEPDVIAKVVDIARRHNMWVVSDECYDELGHDAIPLSPASLPDSEHVISVFSFSKTHAMTGWRLGYVVAPDSLSEPVARVQEPLVMGINAAAQFGGIAALEESTHVEMMRGVYARRCTRIVNQFRAADIDVATPAGAFYLWMDIRGTGIDDRAFIESLLQDEHVAGAPGSSFGAAGIGCVRFSLAAADDVLEEAAHRIIRHLNRVQSDAVT
jgi:aspartate aminotransferase